MVIKRDQIWKQEIGGLPVYASHEAPDPVFHENKISGRKVKKILTKEFCTFDIETSSLRKDLNIMYIWMMCIAGEYCVYGRTWDDFLGYIARFNLPENVYLPIYVHNLSYEFQYIRGLFDFEETDVLVTGPRRILKATTGQIEFRCSYYLSNMSLKLWCEAMQVPHPKEDGDEFDYRKRRLPNTKLTAQEMKYAIMDVISQYECLERQLAYDNDDLYTIPMTATGYVRRDAKKALSKLRRKMRDIFPSANTMRLLREAFRGGNAHASRFYATDILTDVYSYDRQSSYIDNMINDKYPVSKFEDRPDTLTEFAKVVKTGRPFLARLRLTNISLRNPFWGFPYIAVDKCRRLRKYTNDNGRVLDAALLEITVTDIDYRIISEEYSYNIDEVMALEVSSYGVLPKPYRDVIMQYYRVKTKLKNVPGKEDLYGKSKNKLNASYGMMVQNPVKPNIVYRNGDYVLDEESSFEALLDKYHEHGFLPYQWGVWVTAWARLRLEEGLKIAGEDAVYCDTDSVKSMLPVDFSEFNRIRVDSCRITGGYAPDSDDNLQYLGIYDDEGTYEKFVTLGSKKYAYIKKGELHITIAGVGKIKGAKELLEAGGISALKEGYIFSAAASDEWTYNDCETHEEIIDGLPVIVTPNVSAIPSTYTVGLSKDYAQLLKDVIQFKRFLPIKA